MLIGVVGAVILLCAAAIWFVMGRVAGQPEVAAVQETRISTPSTTRTSAPSPTAPAPEPETVTLSQAGLSVELPAGFALAPDEDMWRATGPDPDLRIQFAVDPLYGVPADAVLDQVEREISDDCLLYTSDAADE